MPTSDGYPTEAELEKIEKWDIFTESVWDLLEHVRSCWWMPDWGFRWNKRKTRLYLSTGGWSGNEEIIDTLESTIFYGVCWVQARRGGHYTLEIPKWLRQKAREMKKEGT